MMVVEEATSRYLQNTAKAKLRKQFFGAVTYFLVIMAIGASLTLFAVSGKLEEDETLLVIISSLLYGTAVIAMIWMMIYTGQNQYASLEAMEGSVFTGSKIKFSARGDTIHSWLRVGLCLFASMSVSYCVSHCYEITVVRKVTAGNVILHTFLAFFLIIQACFILFFHKLIIFTDSRRFKYLFMHLAAVNLCVVVQVSSMNLFINHNTDDRQYHSEWMFTISSVLQYLFPAMVEFCTIAAVILFELARCSGHIDKVKPRKFEIGLPERSGRLIWTIVGCTLAACTLIFVVALEIIGYRLGSVRHILHMAEVGLFSLLALTLVGVSLKLIRRLKFTVSYSRKQVEEVLLIVTTALAIVYFVACIFLAAGHICKGSAKNNLEVHLLRMQIALSILQLFHVLLQTYLLQDNLYRCCHDENSLANRPGRPFLVLLTFLNISLWMVHSFQVIKNDQLHKFSKDNLIMDHMGAVFTAVQLTMPMVMLYYFISAVCLQVAIKHAYTEEGARFDRSQQWRNVDNTISILPFLEEHSKPFATGDSHRNSLAYENRADAFFQDLPVQSIPGRPSNEQHPPSQRAKETSNIERIRTMTKNDGSDHTANLAGKMTVGGGMVVGDRFWDEQEENTGKSGKSDEELNETHEESDYPEWEHPAMSHQPSTEYKQGGFGFRQDEDYFQSTIEEENGEQLESILNLCKESEQSTTNPVLETSDTRNSDTNQRQICEVDFDSDSNFDDVMKKITSVPGASSNAEGHNGVEWKNQTFSHQPSTDYTPEAFDFPNVGEIVHSAPGNAKGAAPETFADDESDRG